MKNSEIIECITEMFKKRLIKESDNMYIKKREMHMCIERWYLNVNMKHNIQKKRMRDEQHDTDDE